MEGEGWWARRETAETFSGLSDECFAGEASGEGRGGGRPQRRAGSEQVTGSSAPSSAVPRHGHSRSARRRRRRPLLPAFGFVSHATDFSTIFYASPLFFFFTTASLPLHSFSATSSFSSFGNDRIVIPIGHYIDVLLRAIVVFSTRERERGGGERFFKEG